MPERRFRHRLYLRIWLAVLAALLLTAFLAFAAWRLGTAADEPREVTLTDARGNTVARARIDFRNDPGRVRVELDDGRVLFARWREAPAMRPGMGFALWLALIVGAVGLGAYPVARRLTRRLERLERGVDAFGEGDLKARVEVRGHDEVARLAARFNHAAARIEALVASHRDLLANASHELRSPLARIRMGVEMLANGKENAAAGEIARDIAELDALIEEILIASRLDARGIQDEAFEDVDMTALAAEECARSDGELEAAGILHVRGSRRLLRRALRNLLENARRHGGTGAAPDVVLREGDGMVEIAVQDRGPGVPEDERERVFEPFYRMKGASEADGGVGLGLALVRKIVRLHGGEVHCEARAGGGASFRIVLPGSASPDSTRS